MPSKIRGSWKLHKALPADLSFFILLSSISGILGNEGQANYASSSTYQDALAHYRVERGQKAVSLDLAAIHETSSSALTPEIASRIESRGNIRFMKPQDLGALLDRYCDPSLGLLSHAECQRILGVVPPTDKRAKGLEPANYLYEPAWRMMWLDEGGATAASVQDESFDDVAEFKSVESQQDAAVVISRALVEKMCQSLALDQSAIDVNGPMHEYGVDSLVGVEVHNWVARKFDTDIAVFDILGESTFATVGALVAERSPLRQGKQDT